MGVVSDDPERGSGSISTLLQRGINEIRGSERNCFSASGNSPE